MNTVITKSFPKKNPILYKKILISQVQKATYLKSRNKVELGIYIYKDNQEVEP